MIITLITDFGNRDPYVAMMKGVILSISPHVSIVDISHAVPPHDIDEAGLILKRSYSFFPENTIHVIVVDPGVGSDRAIIAVKTDHYIFLAPDNGVLQPVLSEYPEADIFQVTNEKYFLQEVSNTFHGRDIFAPVAAHLANGVELSDIGDPFSDFVARSIPKPVKTEDGVTGVVTGFDHFGNVLTNIHSELLPENLKYIIQLQSNNINSIHKSYSDVPDGEVLGLIGSSGVLEISINRGNARDQLTVSKGDPVVVKLKSDGESSES